MSTETDKKEEKTETVLDQSASEVLVFGCIRLWYLLCFPDVLCHLIVHYYGVTFLWTINEPNNDHDAESVLNLKFKSKPFEINGITFQSYFSPTFGDDDVTVFGNLYSKILSMSNTIRTCTVYYQYNIFNRSYKSRHTYNLTASRAILENTYFHAFPKNAIYPIHISINVEPMRIHHWSYDNIIDYQQDILMKEYLKYQWRFNLMDDNNKYLQSNMFGAWCLDLNIMTDTLYLKLLRLAPNVTRIKIECIAKSINWKSELEYDDILEFTFTNDGISTTLEWRSDDDFVENLAEYLENITDGTNRKYDKMKDTIFDIEIRIIEVYAIDSNKIDDFEYGNDKKIPITKWSQYGII